MTKQTRATLKGYFNTGDTPTESNFADLIDSFVMSTVELVSENFITQVDGIANSFSMQNTFLPESVKVYLNGLLQNPIYYTINISTKTVTLSFVPMIGDELLIEYQIFI